MPEGAPERRPGGWRSRGEVLAIVAALAFGVTTPLIQRFGSGVGAAATASLLYAGAALASVGGFRGPSDREASLRFAHWPRLFIVTLVGAVFAPICLAWGLRHTDGASASLLLNFEAVFTVVLAWGLYREAIGRRLALALLAMAGGGACLVLGGGLLSAGFGLGAVAVVLATLGWALDNTLARPLAELSPTQVVSCKGALGALLSLALALLSKQRFPELAPALGLLLCGATGYGLSLRLYLHAQRRIGAARTGSIFALAPFAGAAVAWSIGQGRLSWSSAAAAICFGLGVFLHLTEKHAHRHTHQSLEHEHAHRHDDGHHDHAHEPPVIGQHNHRHAHDGRTHDHPHTPDVHHRHEHD